MAHIHRHTNSRGDVDDLSYFCSDFCHQQWCRETNTPYEGWDGLHEVEFTIECEECFDPIRGTSDEGWVD